MSNKEEKLITVLIPFLNRNSEDVIYKNVKELEPHINDKLRRKVLQYYWNNDSEFKETIGLLQQYFEPGNTMYDFYSNILQAMGNGDTKKGSGRFINYLNSIAKEIKDKLKLSETIQAIKDIILIQLLYKSYVGFFAEEYINTILEDEGLFNLEASRDLDHKYKIDLLVSLKDPLYKDKIGIQFKSESFITIAPTYKQNSLRGNINAINKGIAKDIVYIVHTSLGEPLRTDIAVLHKKEKICNISRLDNLEVATKDEIIDELLYLLLRSYNVDIEEFKKEQKKSLSTTPIVR